ncbi:hypothetical protein SEPCBS119000_006085 [Sporothrix epigloea]|uniref:DUF3824 domain-containing protein n=1 Tax=Sporothrix epigloea TaxID=1892477 RepID=A0ABP0E483_9PEZI
MAYSSDNSDHYKSTIVRRYKVGKSGDHVELTDKIERMGRSDGYQPPRRSSDNPFNRTRRADENDRVIYERTQEVDYFDRESTKREACGRRDGDIVVTSESYDDPRDDNYGLIARWHRETDYYKPATQQLRSVGPPATALRPHNALAIREREVADSRDWNLVSRGSRLKDNTFIESQEEVTAVDQYTKRNLKDQDENRARHQQSYHHHRDQSSHSEFDSDDSFYVKKTTVIRPAPASDNHRLHLTEGALAGAGLGALLSSRRNQKTGELPEHRGRKVLAGAALGALGTEILKRANSVYQDRSFENNGDVNNRARSRSRSGKNMRRSTSHKTTKLKTGLGLAAAALAVAGAAKYMQSSRIENEERNRGRSLRRYSDGEDFSGRTRSRSRPSSRAASVAKVAAGTAAMAGIIHHLRAKSRQRDSKPARSHSHLHTGVEIAGAALAGAAAKKLYDKYGNKKNVDGVHKKTLPSEDEEYSGDSRKGFTRPGSRSRSAPSMSPPPLSGTTRNPRPPTGTGPELGLVEYGSRPLYGEPATTTRFADSSDSEDQKNRPRRRRQSFGDDYHGDKAETVADNFSTEHQRNRSQLRQLAATGASAAAAAIGIKTKNSRKRKDADAKKSFKLGRHRHENSDGYDSRPSYNQSHYYPDEYGDDDNFEHRRHRYRHDHDRDIDSGYDHDDSDSQCPSPPHASGGAFFPKPASEAQMAGRLMQHPNNDLASIHEQNFPVKSAISDYAPQIDTSDARTESTLYPGHSASVPANVADRSAAVHGSTPYPASFPPTPAAGSSLSPPVDADSPVPPSAPPPICVGSAPPMGNSGSLGNKRSQ